MLPAFILGAVAAASPGWSAAVEQAESVRNLGRFLETYVGECERDDPKLDKRSCRQEQAKVRKQWAGKRLHLRIDNLDGLFRVVGFDERKGAFKVDLVPLFAERVLGLTIGRPKRLNSDGQPILRTIRLTVKRPAGMPEFIFKKKLARARLEMVVVPKRTWLIKTKEEPLQGLEVTPVALRLLEGRGDVVLAEKVYR